MNGHDCNDWMTTCEREGYTDGWEPLAWLEHEKYVLTMELETHPWIAAVAVSVIVLVIAGIAGGKYYYHHRQNQQTFERVGGELEEPSKEPLVY